MSLNKKGRNMTLNKFRLAAFLEQFPFLASGEEPLVDAERVEAVRVSRIDEDFLHHIPFSDTIEHVLGGLPSKNG